MKASTPILVCDIAAPTWPHARALAQIATDCARDVAQPLELRPRVRAAAESLLTLRLPAALAATQHPVWCLACRLACFCPDARVSVLVEATETFSPPARRRSIRPAA